MYYGISCTMIRTVRLVSDPSTLLLKGARRRSIGWREGEKVDNRASMRSRTCGPQSYEQQYDIGASQNVKT